MPKTLVFDSKQAAEATIRQNQIRKFSIDNLIICIARTSSGFFAFEEKCPHMTDDLSKGQINNLNEVVCPWHAYRFNLKTGRETEQRCKGLKIYELVWENNSLWVVV